MITKIFNANTDLGVNKKGTALGPKIISEKMNLEVVNIDYTLLPEKDIKNKNNTIIYFFILPPNIIKIISLFI